MFSFNEISCVSKDENWIKNRFVSFYAKNFDYPEKTLKYKHIRRISD